MTTDTETSPKIDCPKDNKHNESNEKSKDEYKSKNKENESNNKKSRRRSRTRSRTRSRSRSRSRDKKRHKRYYKDDDYPESYPRYYGDDSDDKRNNDKYWNKYPKRDEIVIGKRYYGESDKNKKHKDDQHKSNESGDSKSKEKKPIDLMTKTGGAYIPPAKLRLMQAEITDKKSVAYQRIAWEALKKSIHGYINKVNTSNIGIISKEILHENIVRGRGLLCKSIIQAQAASPTFTNVYAALVAVINSKFPNIGELLLKRLVLQFKRGFKQNNKSICISATTFVAHLVNQRVAHEILALEILTLLVESPTDDSVEVAISFLKECGQKLTEVSSKGINAIFEMLRNILHEGKLEQRIQYMIEVMFQIRKDGFKDHAAVIEELDLVEEEDQFTHLISLDDVKQDNAEEILNVFKFDENYEENEGKYVSLRKEILDSSGDSESSSGSENEKNSDEDDDDDDDDDNEDIEQQKENTIIDNTETNLVALRRTIYLTIQSSLDFEECAHKLMKMELKPGQEIELCHMFLDCCAEQRTYEKFYGLLAQRFCQVNNIYVEPFQQIFKDTYATTHRLDTGKLRNVGKFFAHLLFTDAISWEVLSIMKLNEEDTNSSNRIFIKVLFQELAEYMGLEKLNVRLKDGTLQEHFVGLFPKDNPKNTRFSINFFTSIGLGGLTAELRDHLKTVPKTLPQIITTNTNDDDTSNSSSSNSSSSNSSSSSSGSSSNSSNDSSDSSSSNSSSSEDSSNSSSDESSEDDKKRKKKIEKQKQIKNNKSKEKKKLSEKKRDNRNDKENLKDLRKEEHNKYKQEHRNKLDYKNRDDYKRRNDYRSDNRDKYNRREKNDYKEKNNYKEKRNNYKDRCESNRNHRRGNSKDKSPH